jgi:hypothetical protein
MLPMDLLRLPNKKKNSGTQLHFLSQVLKNVLLLLTPYFFIYLGSKPETYTFILRPSIYLTNDISMLPAVMFLLPLDYTTTNM